MSSKPRSRRQFLRQVGIATGLAAVPLARRARAQTKLGGAPLLEKNVHVGIGATLYGPITVGEGTKIMAGCVLSRSVPARSIVEAPTPQVGSRAPARDPANRV